MFRTKSFFVFGVIRDPVDYLLSLYNSHQKPAFDGTSNPTRSGARKRSSPAQTLGFHSAGQGRGTLQAAAPTL